MVKNQKKMKLIVGKKKGTQKQELTRLGAALRALGGLGGGAVGSLIGMPGGGSSAGTSLGAALSRWLGSGDYSVNNNTVLNRTLRGSDSIPAMHKDGQTVVVRHKEFVTEVRSSTSFKVLNSYELNPGRHETFPWLAAIAGNFQEYKIRGLVWHYVPTSGTAVSGTNAALGSVMLQTSYRANDTAPTTKAEFLNEYWSSEAVPSDAFAHPIECDPKENPFNIQYVRSDKVPDGDSILMYDLGVTHLAVSGQQVNDVVLGDLWCTYEVELKKPIVDSNVTSPVRGAGLYTYGTIGPTTLFTGTQVQSGTLDIKAAGNFITFPPKLRGTYIITVRVLGTLSGVQWNGAPTYNNCSGTVLPGGSSIWPTVTSTFAGPQLMYTTVVQILDSSKTASVALPAPSGGSFTESTMVITPYPAF